MKNSSSVRLCEIEVLACGLCNRCEFRQLLENNRPDPEMNASPIISMDSHFKYFTYLLYRYSETTYAAVGKITFYGIEACPLTKSDLRSLDFVINRFFMKLFSN